MNKTILIFDIATGTLCLVNAALAIPGRNWGTIFGFTVAFICIVRLIATNLITM